MQEVLKQKLIELAEKYENAAFLEKDPSKFMHLYKDRTEQEIAAFLSASLAFGRRDQILKHIEIILEQTKVLGLTQWVLQEEYKKYFTKGKASFYRVYSHEDMNAFFDGIKIMLKEKGSIGEYLKMLYVESNQEKPLYLIIQEFYKGTTALIPNNKNGAAKKINLFLRWMVRSSSAVDLGLWNSWYSCKNLLMPLDVHVMEQSYELKLLPFTSCGKQMSPSLKTAILLTEKMKEVFPEDPVKADFALFGYGVDGEK